MEQKPLIIGHRGCRCRGIRANSCEAVERAIQEKADIVELDVVFTKGKFVGYHPRFLQKHPFLNKEVDSFEDLLINLDNRALLYVDVKENFSPEKMDALAELIKKYYKKQVILGSFYRPVLKYFREKGRSWIINYHCLALKNNIKRAAAMEADWINPVPFFVSREFFEESMSQGLKVVPAGNENYRKQARFARLGAYALSTFKPVFLRQYLSKCL